MATFKIGQRVKKVMKVGTLPGPNIVPIGAESIVVGFGGVDNDGTIYDLTVERKNYPDGIKTFANGWEPIQYDGMQKITWDACVWMPEHMRDKVKEAA